MVQSKATKKFEKHHLKGELERRNGQKKNKQRAQIKAKKKSRRAEENGLDANSTERPTPAVRDGGAKSAKDAFKDMSVDEFFAGGFEIPEKLEKGGKKRKRQQEEAKEPESDSDRDSSVDEVTAAAGDPDSDSEGDDEFDMEALRKNDPELYKSLQSEDPDLFNSNLDDMQLSGEESDEPEKKKRKKSKSKAAEDESDEEGIEQGSNELDKATVAKWNQAMQEQYSLRAAKETVLAFRAAAHVSEDDDSRDYKYSISSPEVYHSLLTTALKQIPVVLQHHLPVQESKSGKVKVDLENKKFKNLGPLLKSHISSVLHLLANLSDALTLRTTLTSTLPLLPYLLSFKKVIRDVAKAASSIWASGASTEATRIAAFLVLRRLAVIGDPGIRENVLKAAYQGLVSGARNTTIHTLAGINLMKNSAAELWGIDTSVGYTNGFNFIRQLAIHLRQSIVKAGKEGYKAVYNWQYVHSLDFWSRVLSAHAIEPTSPLRPLLYPLVQVTLGALRLIPTATYFPLRFQLVRALLRISRTTGTFIPIAPALYEVLNTAEMRKPPKPATLKPLDFTIAIRAPKSYLRTRTYQDGVGEQVAELLSEYFVLWAKSIAFPELALPVTVMLKRWLKDAGNRAPGKGNKNQKVNGSIQLVVQKIESNTKWIDERRAKVEFAPNDRRGVESFLKDVDWEKTPIGAYVVTQRKIRDDKAKMAEEARKEDEKKRAQEKIKANGEASGEAEDEEDASESESSEGEEAFEGLDDDEDSE
ncbi:Noc2-domain-containing protein [Polychaeton citri CBS 116435]|uniref:Noc2-domain-containing protein n=1 Tax=Polychaeton citri CBS 116435 TaxID=1314669 RepID=A0A9P4UNW1_9PEZI|nr:Noc2-domain-containing protein [Polychaeton citri CBS 116435]